MIKVKVELKFAIEKETKNCYRFKEVTAVDKPAVIGTIYVQKSAFENKPAGIEVVIQGVEATEGGGAESV